MRPFGFALGALVIGAVLAVPFSWTQDRTMSSAKTFTWSFPDASFGGFSGLAVAQGGLDFVALNDRGAWIAGRFNRDAQGDIQSISQGNLSFLKARGIEPLSRFRNDSEDLAIAADGTAYVGFEGVARVLRYRSLDGVAENLPDHPDFAQYSGNRAFESLAIDQVGALYVLPERSIYDPDQIPLYRFDKGGWTKPFYLPKSNGFDPVSADFGPDGGLYVLERRFTFLEGFASRLRKFLINAQGVQLAETLFESPFGTYDNLEALSLWEGSDGILRATMLSDDNFFMFQNTQFVELILTR